MLTSAKPFAPAIAAFLAGVAVDVSGVENPALAVVLIALAALLLAWPIWDRLVSVVAASSWQSGLQRLGAEPLGLLLLGSSALTVALSLFPARLLGRMSYNAVSQAILEWQLNRARRPSRY